MFENRSIRRFPRAVQWTVDNLSTVAEFFETTHYGVTINHGIAIIADVDPDSSIPGIAVDPYSWIIDGDPPVVITDQQYRALLRHRADRDDYDAAAEDAFHIMLMAAAHMSEKDLQARMVGMSCGGWEHHIESTILDLWAAGVTLHQWMYDIVARSWNHWIPDRNLPDFTVVPNDQESNDTRRFAVNHNRYPISTLDEFQRYLMMFFESVHGSSPGSWSIVSSIPIPKGDYDITDAVQYLHGTKMIELGTTSDNEQVARYVDPRRDQLYTRSIENTSKIEKIIKVLNQSISYSGGNTEASLHFTAADPTVLRHYELDMSPIHIRTKVTKTPPPQ